MDLVKHVPAQIAPPFGAYSHAVEVPAGFRTLVISGQVGVAADGSLPAGIGKQCEQAFHNLLAILASAGMSTADLVRLGVFLTRAEDVAAYRMARDRVMEGCKPASTLLVVAALADPRWLVEIEAIAAAR